MLARRRILASLLGTFALIGVVSATAAGLYDYTDEELASRSTRVQRLLGHRSYDPRPHFGGGLWLRNVNKIEDPSGRS